VTKILLTLLLLLLSFTLVNADELTEVEQIQIIVDYMQTTGQEVSAEALEDAGRHGFEQGHWCGTSAITRFKDNFDKLDRNLLKSMGAELFPRPADLPEQHVSPSGLFKIHYAIVGEDEVYRSGVDVNSNGVPDYVDDVAATLDYVHGYITDTLGYNSPPDDSFYPEGGDSAYDVYLQSLSLLYYGQTFPDSLFWDYDPSILGDSIILATSFMILRNDYSVVPGYETRPLDAMRATVAHEYFHSVQFGIDYTEAAGANAEKRYWMEMSAVWMEEEIYDDVNDYYSYLPVFFDNPEASIQQFLSILDLHPYAAAIYAIYLTEKYDRDVIRSIWERCRLYGGGPDFLTSADVVIDSVSGGAYSFPRTMGEFAVWNFFSGERSHQAPNDIGYEEKEAYPGITDDVVHDFQTYPVLLTGDNNPSPPDHNGTYYLRFREMNTIKTRFWECLDGTFPNCSDSIEVFDTAGIGPDFLSVDTLFRVWFLNGDPGDELNPTLPNDWTVNVIYQLDSDVDSFEVDYLTLPDDAVNALDLPFPNLYRTVTFVMSPSSTNPLFYDQVSYRSQKLGYYVPEEGLIDSARVNLPAAIFAPYPNPWVASEQSEANVRFMFQMPTDTASFPIYAEVINPGGGFDETEPQLYVDIYTVAGERLRTLDAVYRSDWRKGVYWASWDLKNEAGKDVASGIYLAHAQLYSKTKSGVLLHEKTTKLAVIR